MHNLLNYNSTIDDIIDKLSKDNNSFTKNNKYILLQIIHLYTIHYELEDINIEN